MYERIIRRKWSQVNTLLLNQKINENDTRLAHPQENTVIGRILAQFWLTKMINLK